MVSFYSYFLTCNDSANVHDVVREYLQWRQCMRACVREDVCVLVCEKERKTGKADSGRHCVWTCELDGNSGGNGVRIYIFFFIYINPSIKIIMTLIFSFSGHINHIRDVAGLDNVGVGADFDGIDKWVAENYKEPIFYDPFPCVLSFAPSSLFFILPQGNEKKDDLSLKVFGLSSLNHPSKDEPQQDEREAGTFAVSLAPWYLRHDRQQAGNTFL